MDLLIDFFDTSAGKYVETIRKHLDPGKNIDLIKSLELRLQISLDGPQHINDINRYYKSKSSSYQDIIDGIILCKKYSIPYSIHGVLAEEGLLNYLDIIKWRIDLFEKYAIDDTIESLFGGNWAMVVIENDYNDEFIDKFLIELEKTADWIMETKYSNKEKKILYNNIILRNNMPGICGAGCGLKTLDTNNNIYPCHRSVDELTSYNLKDNICLGNIDNVEDFKNFKYFNRFDDINKSGFMYSNGFIIDRNNFYKTNKYNNNNTGWNMSCPTTNLETSNNEAYINAKYIVFIKEINNFVNTYLQNKYWPKKKQINI